MHVGTPRARDRARCAAQSLTWGEEQTRQRELIVSATFSAQALETLTQIVAATT